MRRAVTSVLGLALLFHGAIYLTHAWATLNFPFQLDYGEGAVLYLAEILRRHEPLYRSLDHPPFLACLYAPLFPWLNSLLLSDPPGFWPGRLLSESSTLLAAFSLALWLGRRYGAVAGLSAAGFFLANPVVLGWTCLSRIDPVGLVLTLWGLLLACSRPPDSARLQPRDGLAALCFTLAFLDKQTFVAAPICVALGLARGNLRLGIHYTLLQAAFVGLALAGLYGYSQGRFFELLFRYNAMPFSLEQLRQYLQGYALFLVPLVLLAWRAKQAPLIMKFYAVASLWVVLGSGRMGADYNYFLELHLILSGLAGVGLSRELEEGRPARASGLAVTVALVQILGIGLFLQLGPTFYSPWQYLNYEALPLWQGQQPKYLARGLQAGQELQSIIAAHPGPVIAENMGHALLAGRVPWMCDPHTFAWITYRGMWNDELVLDPLRHGQVGIVILQRLENNPRFTDRLIQTVKGNYRYLGPVGVEHVFVPKESAGR